MTKGVVALSPEPEAPMIEVLEKKKNTNIQKNSKQKIQKM